MDSAGMVLATETMKEDDDEDELTLTQAVLTQTVARRKKKVHPEADEQQIDWEIKCLEEKILKLQRYKIRQEEKQYEEKINSLDVESSKDPSPEGWDTSPEQDCQVGLRHFF